MMKIIPWESRVRCSIGSFDSSFPHSAQLQSQPARFADLCCAKQPSLSFLVWILILFYFNKRFQSSEERVFLLYPPFRYSFGFDTFQFINFTHCGCGAGFSILTMAETVWSLYSLFFKCWGTSGLYFGHEEGGRCPCPQNFCSFCAYWVCLSLCCIFPAGAFSCRGRIYYSTYLLCASAGSRGKFGLFSMQFKCCLKRSHGLDNNFSNKFNTLISLGWR